MTGLKSGEAKIEFFTNFDFIKSKYDEGYVVGTKLFKIIQDERNIKMKYVQFNKYFQEFIFRKDERFFSIAIKKEELKTVKETPKVKKIEIGAANKKKNFNPHTREIRPEDIL